MKRRDIGSGSSHLDLNRRSFLRAASFAGAAVAIGGFSEAQFAFAQARHHSLLPENMVFLNANENPLGPCAAARAAMLEGITQSAITTNMPRS